MATNYVIAPKSAKVTTSPYKGGTPTATSLPKAVGNPTLVNASTRGPMSAPSSYVTSQQQRYNQAVASGDRDLQARLMVDSNRMGYNLGGGGANPQSVIGDASAPTPQSQPTYSGGSGGGSVGGSGDYANTYFNKFSEMANNWATASREAQMAAIRSARETGIGDINLQKQALDPRYAQMKNEADVNNAADVNKLRELMASQGLADSGDNVTGMHALQLARENAINNFNTQKEQEIAGYNKRIADLNNPNDEVALEKALQADKMKMLFGAWNDAQNYGLKQQDFNYNKEQDARKFGLDQQTLAETSRHNQASEENTATGDKVNLMKAMVSERQDKFNNAWKTAENIGHVTSELAAIVPGLTVGMPTLEAEKAAQQYKYQLDQLKIQQENADSNRIRANKSGSKSGNSNTGGLSTYQYNQYRQTAIKQLSEQFGNKTYDAATGTYVPANPKYVWGNMSAQQKEDLINRRTQQLSGTGQTTSKPVYNTPAKKSIINKNAYSRWLK